MLRVKLFILQMFMAFLAMPAQAETVRAERIVSINVCGDQWLLELVEPERIAALSWLASDVGLSRLSEQAAPYPKVKLDIEGILTHSPDLVIAGSYGSATTVAMLQKLDIPVLMLPYPQTLREIAALSRSLGYQLQVPERGERIALQLEQLEQQPIIHGIAGQHPAVMLWREAGDVIGGGTLEDEALQRAGGINLATREDITGHIGLERLLRLNPQHIVVLSHYSQSQPSVNNWLRRHPAMQKAALNIRYFPGNRFMCGEPGIIGTIAELRRFLQEEDA